MWITDRLARNLFRGLKVTLEGQGLKIFGEKGCSIQILKDQSGFRWISSHVFLLIFTFLKKTKRRDKNQEGSSYKIKCLKIVSFRSAFSCCHLVVCSPSTGLSTSHAPKRSSHWMGFTKATTRQQQEKKIIIKRVFHDFREPLATSRCETLPPLSPHYYLCEQCPAVHKKLILESYFC